MPVREFVAGALQHPSLRMLDCGSLLSLLQQLRDQAIAALDDIAFDAQTPLGMPGCERAAGGVIHVFEQVPAIVREPFGVVQTFVATRQREDIDHHGVWTQCHRFTTGQPDARHCGKQLP